MQEQLFDHLPFKQTYVPNGMASDLEEECKRYESILAANPVDLRFLESVKTVTSDLMSQEHRLILQQTLLN